jgi:hypothetical protein
MSRARDRAFGVVEQSVAGALAGMFVANGAALAAFVAAWHVMGVDRALERGTWDESDLFAGVVVLLVGCAGAVGGAACVAIARRWWVVVATALILLAWWGAEGVLRVDRLETGMCAPRGASATFVEGAREGFIREPAWSALVCPVAIGVGVMLGGLRRPCPSGEAPRATPSGLSPSRGGARGRARACGRRP